MKISYIVNSLNLGGTEQLVVQMSQAFASEFDISVVCLDEPGIWAPRLRGQGIPVHCLWRQPGIDLSMAMKLANYNRQNSIQLMHAHQSTPWFYGALSRFFHPAPKLLFEEHGRFYPEIKNWKKNLFNRIVLQPLTNRFVGVSKDVKSRVASFEGVSSARIEVVYNGTTASPPITEKEKQDLRRELGLSQDDFVVGTVGRLDPIKNLPLLVNALAGLKGKIASLRGLLVGNGPCAEEIKALITANGLSDTVVMPGYRQDATRILQCMDLFVLCSFSEGTSMALLEAMAAGVPSIVTAVGGNPELIQDDHNGWVIPSDDLEALAGAISEAYKNQERTQQLAENAKRMYREKFTFDKMIESYRERYRLMSTNDQ